MYEIPQREREVFTTIDVLEEVNVGNTI